MPSLIKLFIYFYLQYYGIKNMAQTIQTNFPSAHFPGVVVNVLLSYYLSCGRDSGLVEIALRHFWVINKIENRDGHKESIGVG